MMQQRRRRRGRESHRGRRWMCHMMQGAHSRSLCGAGPRRGGKHLKWKYCRRASHRLTFTSETSGRTERTPRPQAPTEQNTWFILWRTRSDVYWISSPDIRCNQTQAASPIRLKRDSVSLTNCTSWQDPSDCSDIFNKPGTREVFPEKCGVTLLLLCCCWQFVSGPASKYLVDGGISAVSWGSSRC